MKKISMHEELFEIIYYLYPVDEVKFPYNSPLYRYMFSEIVELKKIYGNKGLSQSELQEKAIMETRKFPWLLTDEDKLNKFIKAYVFFYEFTDYIAE